MHLFSLWMTTAVNNSHFFHSKVTAELFSERQNASSSTCTLWVTVSISAICRLVSPYTLHCVVPLSCLDSATCIAVYFLSVRPFLFSFCTLLHVWSLLRVFVQVRNPTCPYCLVRCTTLIGLCDFVLFLRHFFHSVCFLFIPDCACACVCTRGALLQACISQVCVCACMYVCVYNPRPFNSTTWIHPISRSPWLPGPLITEGPGRSNRCASWLCVSSTTVARNLCCMQHTGACHLWRKTAWAQKHCRDVLVWSGECVCVCFCTRCPCEKQCEVRFFWEFFCFFVCLHFMELLLQDLVLRLKFKIHQWMFEEIQSCTFMKKVKIILTSVSQPCSHDANLLSLKGRL